MELTVERFALRFLVYVALGFTSWINLKTEGVMFYWRLARPLAVHVMLVLCITAYISCVKAADNGEDHSYLPPWMREQSGKPTVTADKGPETPAAAARLVASDTVASKPKPVQAENKPGFLSNLWHSLDFMRPKWSVH